MLKEDSFFDDVKSKIKIGIKNKKLNIAEIRNLLKKYNYEILDEFRNLTNKLKRIDFTQNLNFYGDIFKAIQNTLKSFKKFNKLQKNLILTDRFIEEFIEKIVNSLVIEKLCGECNSGNIYQTVNPFNENFITYYCRECRKSVKVLKNTLNLPYFLKYLQKWELSENNFQFKRKSNYTKEFIHYLFSDCLDYFNDLGKFNSISLFYEIAERNKIYHEILENKSVFKEILIDNLKNSLKHQDFFNFFEGSIFYKKEFGDIPEDFKGKIVDSIIMSLKSGNIAKIKHAIDNLKEEISSDLIFLTSNKKIKQRIENNFYDGLSKCLKESEFENFRQMVNSSDIFDIFIDVRKIPKRFDTISELFRKNLQEVTESYQTSSLGKNIELLRFCNEFNLFDRDLSKEDSNLIKELKKDKLLISNLNDLFGKVSNSFILYARNVMPRDLYDFFIDDTMSYSFLANTEQMVSYIIIFFDRYFIYGLSVENLGTVKRFIGKFEKTLNEKKEPSQQGTEHSDGDLKFIEFYFKNKKHLVSTENLIKNKDKILAKNDFKFYNLSMVLLGGLGPQGHGFTYSTPKGEVIEVCSDIRENDAIIVKYRQFLKQQFLVKLRKELTNLEINLNNIEKIINYLSETLNQKEIITYRKKEPILREIRGFLREDPNYQKISIKEYQDLINKISNAMDLILRPIKMIDQFKCRMDLADENKIRSEDIAKLTSLKGKSHYDVLRERFFFQYIVKWFYGVYASEKLLNR